MLTFKNKLEEMKRNNEICPQCGSENYNHCTYGEECNDCGYSACYL